MMRGLLALALPIVVGFLGPLGGASTANPQKTASLRYVGVLEGGVWFNELRQAFRQGLLDEGFVEGRDVVIEWRSAHGDYSRAPQSVADLIQHKVDVIVVNTTLQALAARHATSTIPIVMAGVTDPVGSGLVANLAHPGGNISGTSMMYADLSAKRLQL